MNKKQRIREWKVKNRAETTLRETGNRNIEAMGGKKVLKHTQINHLAGKSSYDKNTINLIILIVKKNLIYSKHLLGCF